MRISLFKILAWGVAVSVLAWVVQNTVNAELTQQCTLTLKPSLTLSIQQAINSVSAGATICLEYGDFSQKDIEIDKSLTLRGKGAYATIIKGSGTINIKSGDVTIEQLALQSYSVLDVRSRTVTIKNSNVNYVGTISVSSNSQLIIIGWSQLR
jgi:alpha-D-ribose 1-methylphosphonate 5-triphosphate synthase subunit PhnL